MFERFVSSVIDVILSPVFLMTDTVVDAMVPGSDPPTYPFDRGGSVWDVPPRPRHVPQPVKKTFVDRLRGHFRKYRYSHLKHGESEIRLLRVLPGAGSSLISCEMKHFSLKNRPAYKALSYTWGDQIPETNVVIKLDKGEISVGANLASFLFEARRDGIDSSWLWIDALCIDQENVRERSRQVLRMKEIYEGAENVIIWLGTAQAEDEIACNMVEYFADVVREQRRHESISLSAPINPKVYGTPGHLFKYEDWNAMKGILFRPWWNRAWIIQEATSPTTLPPVVWCGPKRLKLTDFDDANYCCYKAGLDGDFLEANELFRELFPIHNNKVFGITNTLAARQRKDNDAIALVELLRMVRTFKSTDPRDKVFAILAIAPEVDLRGIHPDYSQPTSSMYTNLATLLINRGELDILGFCGVKKTITYLPSWVPDWTTEVSLFLFPKRQLQPGNTYSKVYNASRGSVASVRFSPNNRILFASGFVFDSVRYASPTRLLSKNLSLQTWAGTALDLNPSYRSGGTKLEAFQRTLCADVKGLETRNAVRNPRDLVSLPEYLHMPPSTLFFQSSLTCDLPEYSKISTAVAGQLDFAADCTMPGAWPEQTPVESSSAVFRSSVVVDQLTSYRKMIKTASGYIGLASSETLPGDKICILAGGQLPFVLRQQKGHYLLMGECYIHGVMDGEAVEAFEQATGGSGDVMQFLEIW